jgi:hypothetical protein
MQSEAAQDCGFVHPERRVTMFEELEAISIQALLDQFGAFTFVVGTADAANRLSKASKIRDGLRVGAP